MKSVSIFSALTVAFLFVFTSPLQSQKTSSMPGKEPQEKRRKQIRLVKEAQLLVKEIRANDLPMWSKENYFQGFQNNYEECIQELNERMQQSLSNEKKQEIQTLQAELFEKIESLPKGESVRELREEMNEKMKLILSEEEMQILEQLKEDFRSCGTMFERRIVRKWMFDDIYEVFSKEGESFSEKWDPLPEEEIQLIDESGRKWLNGESINIFTEEKTREIFRKVLSEEEMQQIDGIVKKYEESSPSCAQNIQLQTQILRARMQILRTCLKSQKKPVMFQDMMGGGMSGHRGMSGDMASFTRPRKNQRTRTRVRPEKETDTDEEISIPGENEIHYRAAKPIASNTSTTNASAERDWGKDFERVLKKAYDAKNNDSLQAFRKDFNKNFFKNSEPHQFRAFWEDAKKDLDPKYWTYWQAFLKDSNTRSR